MKSSLLLDTIFFNGAKLPTNVNIFSPPQIDVQINRFEKTHFRSIPILPHCQSYPNPPGIAADILFRSGKDSSEEPGPQGGGIKKSPYIYPVKEQFIIRFIDNHIRYQAEVKAFEMDEIMIYHVYYSIAPHAYPVRTVQIYPGSGANKGIYWRQRITNKEEELLPPEFVEAAGRAIEEVGDSRKRG